ncbi:MAG: flagellar hook-basal body protein [Planctomycetota bacterium]|jgi:flagellar basal body rod protein FlgG|nr:flagellar hook-basal body protein [Planctomycetota bacterium]
MINGMYLSTMGALVQTGRHATIANNLANANTHGFKPDWSVFEALPTENAWHPERRLLWDKILMNTGGGVWNSTTVANLSPGPMQFTNNPFDVAIRDEPGSETFGFFAIQPDDTDGTVYYSRDGHFVPDQNGVLRTVTGDRVLDVNGATIVLDPPESASVHIDSEGRILYQVAGEGTIEAGQIALWRTADYRQMKKVGDSRFLAEGAQMEQWQNGFMSGNLEESGTSPIEEMTNMIEAARIYDANMRFLTIQDETLGQTVRRVGARSQG